MSEPLTIQNVASRHLLYIGNTWNPTTWNATTCSEELKGKRDALFKVQSCEERGHKIAENVLIRTYYYPSHSLLDVRDLTYQGGTFDFLKCYDKDRWWKLTWLEVAEGRKLTVLFKSYTRGTYLAEVTSGLGVEVIHMDDTTKIMDVPDRAKWELTIESSGGFMAAVYLRMAEFMDQLGRAAPSRTFKATHTNTLAEAVSTVSAIATCARVDGTPGTILEKTSQTFFAKWW